MLRVTPIYGSHGHHPTSKCLSVPPVSTLIEYGGVRVLVDVGWDESRMTTTAQANNNIDSLLPQADAVLVSNSTLSSIGGLPLFFGRNHGRRRQNQMHQQQAVGGRVSRRASGGIGGKRPQQQGRESLSSTAATGTVDGTPSKEAPPIYGTFPTAKMGQMTLYEVHANSCSDGPFVHAGWDLDDVDLVFSTSRFNTLKYSQTITLRSSLRGGGGDSSLRNDGGGGITITAHRAGHVVGASFWILKRIADETEIVVAPGFMYNHAKERHLDSCQLPDRAAAADVLITGPGGPCGVLSKLYSTALGGRPALRVRPWSQMERELIEIIMGALRRGGHVLLPTDASGRVLELLLLLSSHWNRQRLGTTYKLCWVGPMAWNTAEYARSQLEWMAAPLGRQFDSQGGHPFALRDVVLCGTVGEVEELEDEGLPLCVLASGASLDHGPARDLLIRWADNPDNAVVITDSQRCVVRPLSQSAAALALASTVMVPPGARKPKRQSSVAGGGQQEMIDGSGGKGRRDSSIASAVMPPSLLRRQSSGVGAAGHPAPPPGPAEDATAAAAATDEVTDESENLGSALSPSQMSPYSTAAQLLLRWCEAKAAGEEMPDEITVDALVPRRAPLAGEELAAFAAGEEEARRERKAREERKALLREVELARDRLRLGRDEDVSTAAEGVGPATDGNGAGGDSGGRVGDKSSDSASAPGGTKKSSSSTRRKGRFDSNLFLKFSKPLHMTFDVREEAVGIAQPDSVARFGVGESVGAGDNNVVEDGYGISVLPERFHDIVTGIDNTRGRIGDAVGGIGMGVLGGGPDAGATTGAIMGRSRGLGFGADGRPVLTSASAEKSSAAPVDDGEGAGADGEGDEAAGEEEKEQAMEVADLSEGRGIIRGRRGRPPIRVSTVPRRLVVEAEVAYVPLEGRASARSARQMVRALQPRQVVILGGGRPPARTSAVQFHSLSPDGDPAVITDDDEDCGGVEVKGQTQDRKRRRKSRAPPPRSGEAGLLAEAVREVTMRGEDSIFAPGDGETVELRVGHAAYSARLIDTPYLTREEKERGVAAAVNTEQTTTSEEPVEVKVGQYSVSLVDMVATGQKVAADGSIVLAPRAVRRGAAAAEKGGVMRKNVLLSDGEVLLTDLRSEAIAKGMKAEYSAHSGYQQLVVNGKIVVRKDQSTGKISVEGPLCEDYFTVRSVVCSQYTTL